MYDLVKKYYQIPTHSLKRLTPGKAKSKLHVIDDYVITHFYNVGFSAFVFSCFIY